jgi:hypothetical protein
MKGHSISEIETTSFARECLRLCNLRDRKDGVKSFAKYRKREKAAPIQERIYHLQERKDVRFNQLKMSTTGFPKGAVHSGILSRYNLRTDYDLGVGRAAVRRIPCSCQPCRLQLGKPWQPKCSPTQQERYAQNKDCTYWSIFQGENDWLIVDLTATAKTDMDDVEEACYEVIEGLCRQMKDMIRVGQIGAVATDDTSTQGYYLVEWTSDVFEYHSSEDRNEDGIQVEDGCLVVLAKYLSLIQGAPFWYTPSVPGSTSFLARVQTVISADLKLNPIQVGILEPQRNRRHVVENASGVRITDEDHGDLLEEIGRRERIDQEETIISRLQSDDEWSTDEEEEEESDSDDE